MNTKEVEQLIERYFNGDTSLQEEKLLRSFFNSADVPPHMESLKWQFMHFEDAKDLFLQDEYLQVDLKTIPEQYPEVKLWNTRRRILWIGGVAAGIVILITAMFQVNLLINRVDDNISEQELAYNQAKQILYFVSKKLNKGTEELTKVEKLENGMDDLQAMEKFDDGMKQAGKVGKYDQLSKILTTQ